MAIQATDVSLHILTCRYDRVERWCYHNLMAPYWRLYWNQAPGWRIRFGTSSVPLEPSCVILIPPDTPFSARSDCPSRQLYIHFTAAHPLDRARPGVYAQDSTPFRSMIDGLTGGDVAHDSTKGSVLVYALCFGALANLPSDVLRSTRYSPRIEAAMETVLADLSMPPDNVSIAGRLCMNPNSFIRLFKQETGTSPQAWALRRRIEHACMLLHHSALKIEDVAERTGFCDRAHFTRVFTKYRGLGPAKFRRERPS